MLVSADGLPLAVAVTGAIGRDSMLVEPSLDGLVPVKGRGAGRPRRRPGKLYADKAYDNRRVRRYLRRRGITARIARIRVDSSERLGRHRGAVEWTMAWLLAFRRLSIRYDRSATTITALATLATTVICARRLTPKGLLKPSLTGTGFVRKRRRGEGDHDVFGATRPEFGGGSTRPGRYTELWSTLPT